MPSLLSKRKTRAEFETDAETRYKGKLRPIIILPGPFIFKLKIKGTRQQVEVSYNEIIDLAYKKLANAVRAEKLKNKPKKQKKVWQ